MSWSLAMGLACANAKTTGGRYAVCGLRLAAGSWVYVVYRTGRRKK